MYGVALGTMDWCWTCGISDQLWWDIG